MFKLLRLRLVAVAAFYLLLPASAYADAVIISNTLVDSKSAFTWTISFTGLPNPGNLVRFSANYLNPPIDWGLGTDSRMEMLLIDSNGDGVFAVFVDGRHLHGPHDVPGDQDVDPGFAFTLEAQNINALGLENRMLDFDVVQHLHFVGDHSDAVALFGRQVNNTFSFTVTGVHQSVPVPEPATMLLLGTGLAGVAMKLRRKSGIKKGPRGY